MTEKFELGRLVATPGAIEATTLPQHFNLVARHARASRRASLRYARLEARGSPTPNQGFAALFSHQPQNFSYVYEVGLLQRLAGAPMAETQIEWTDATWNPVAGCSIVSVGCTNCYAMEMAKRLEAMQVEKYKGLTRRSGERTIWNGVVREDPAALDIPLRWKKPKKIFVNSMSDLFHERVSDAFILDVWKVMRVTPHHHYQILTKRAERMGEFVGSQIADVLPNVWLGTSIENAEVAERANQLRAVPAAIRFVSFEPLIGSVGAIDLRDIHWAIVGGESGKAARPIQEEWIDEIYDQCSQYETTFFFKQWGTWGKDNRRRSKKANGRIYRGRVWNDMPKAAMMREA